MLKYWEDRVFISINHQLILKIHLVFHLWYSIYTITLRTNFLKMKRKSLVLSYLAQYLKWTVFFPNCVTETAVCLFFFRVCLHCERWKISFPPEGVWRVKNAIILYAVFLPFAQLFWKQNLLLWVSEGMHFTSLLVILQVMNVFYQERLSRVIRNDKNMVETVFQMYADDNFKNIEEWSAMFLRTSHKMKGFISFLTKVICVGFIYPCNTIGKTHTNISVQKYCLCK